MSPATSPTAAISDPAFQRCINPIFLALIPGSGSTNTCAASGCHDTVSGTGGAPLSSDVASHASASYGRDLSSVRVHTDSESAQMAESKGFQAFSYGGDVFGKSSALDTGSDHGKHVMMHELAHVAQQAGAVAASRDGGAVGQEREPEGPVPDRGRDEHPHLEADANKAALNLIAGERSPVASAPLSLSRCSMPSGTAISPAHFQFQTVVSIRPGDGEPAGWQAAAVRASMSKSVGSTPYGSTQCLFEVGVPLRNYQGPVSSMAAATAAATAANSAAYTVLAGGEPVTSVTCIEFRRLMQAELGAIIPGARVSSLIHPNLPIVNFP